MKAVVKHYRGPGLRVEDIPLPNIGPSDVLIKVQVAGICGSDVPIYDWSDPWVQATIRPGQIIGHEFCGTVAALGDEVHNLSSGDFVTAEGHLNCGRCMQCRCGEAHLCPNLKLLGFDYPGAFAEYVSVPVSNVIKLRDIPPAIAAILDPFGNAVHAASCSDLTNSSVLVTGCGPLGLMEIALAKLSGARLIFATDVSSYRMERAAEVGATYAMSASDPETVTAIRDLTVGDSGVDVLFEMSGNPDALVQGLRLLRPGGQAVLMGLPKHPVTVDITNDVITKGIKIQGITGRVMFRTWDQAQKLVGNSRASGRINLAPIITHSVTLDEIESGFNLMQAGMCGKVIVYVDSGLARFEAPLA